VGTIESRSGTALLESLSLSAVSETALHEEAQFELVPMDFASGSSDSPCVGTVMADLVRVP
jgi:hypothetical protein